MCPRVPNKLLKTSPRCCKDQPCSMGSSFSVKGTLDTGLTSVFHILHSSCYSTDLTGVQKLPLNIFIHHFLWVIFLVIHSEVQSSCWSCLQKAVNSFKFITRQWRNVVASQLRFSWKHTKKTKWAFQIEHGTTRNCCTGLKQLIHNIRSFCESEILSICFLFARLKARPHCDLKNQKWVQIVTLRELEMVESDLIDAEIHQLSSSQRSDRSMSPSISENRCPTLTLPI